VVGATSSEGFLVKDDDGHAQALTTHAHAAGLCRLGCGILHANPPPS